MKTALIAGATGLIGKQLLTLLLATNRYDKVIALTRKDLNINSSKLIELKVDFTDFDKYADQLQADDVFCCLGTTMAKAKTKQKFYEVDYSYPLRIGLATKLSGAKQYFLVSALGADKNSGIYYNKVKGEVEEAITNVAFESFHIFRPSLLLGDRAEKRTGEDAAKFVYKFFGFLIPGKYKGIEASKVARAMLHYASQEKDGKFIHESKDLQQF
ncbi:NAD-dependent epimerase/dehydratase family protein [Chryseosolibacter indicus]|uniref:NAD-dependent epimerase/dehydratase family protein n=1 Tax=Chryseosolibacter indicus TaxID=2782351 RepID=A0ABS5VQZ4_9BACT|nr:NAD-dependent epimerase/dehydratase family protein [Chryseosolibacter indicus]MBT1703872.1 NAD-dependent epimerase/dehydratase family protein [Chryseosolibacter indicus]